MKDIIPNFIVSIKEKRQIYLGIAIILVILYHMYCKTPECLPLLPFCKGSIGVDIFLFLSGFGLTNSYMKNSTVRFYQNRLTRIYPLFFLFAVFRSIMYLYEGDQLSLWDWICNLTTLSYYQIGGRVFDWYISAIILLYLAFPVFYRISKWYVILILAYAITIFLWIEGRPYFIYECLIARIPIFMTGILAYRSPQYLWIVILGFILCSPLAVLGVQSSPLSTCMLVLVLMILCMILIDNVLVKQGGGNQIFVNLWDKLIGTISWQWRCFNSFIYILQGN